MLLSRFCATIREIRDFNQEKYGTNRESVTLYQTLWGLNATVHGLCMSSALWGTVVGSLLGGWPTEIYGRRRTLLWIGALYFASSVGTALADGAATFILFRLVGGLGVGVATIASPLYIAEISPARMRGRLAGLFQLNIVFGILAALLSNSLVNWLLPMDIAWRWMLAVMGAPSVLYVICCLTIPESPRWLIGIGQNAAGLAVFRDLNPELSDEEIVSLGEAVEAALAAEAVPKGHTRPPFFRAELQQPILLAVSIACFNQLSGINAVLYFAPRIFEWADLAHNAALLSSVGIGVANLLATLLGLRLIDTLGRRTLLQMGGVGYILSLGGCAAAFATNQLPVVPWLVFAFVAAHAMGQGAVIWVFISEIFPARERSAGQALGSATHWSCAALLTLVFPKVVENFSAAQIFSFFCGMMCLHLTWVLKFMPETRGVSLESMQAHLAPDATKSARVWHRNGGELEELVGGSGSESEM
eukprot:SAG31_NODE_521_length_14624_cov_34.536867_5_plen_474_part_00